MRSTVDAARKGKILIMWCHRLSVHLSVCVCALNGVCEAAVEGFQSYFFLFFFVHHSEALLLADRM